MGAKGARGAKGAKGVIVRALAALGALTLLLVACGADAQNRGAALKFDSARAWEHLRRQVAIGARPAGSAALAECRRYILSELKAAGIETREQPFDAMTPLGPIK